MFSHIFGSLDIFQLLIGLNKYFKARAYLLLSGYIYYLYITKTEALNICVIR